MSLSFFNMNYFTASHLFDHVLYDWLIGSESCQLDRDPNILFLKIDSHDSREFIEDVSNFPTKVISVSCLKKQSILYLLQDTDIPIFYQKYTY